MVSNVLLNKRAIIERCLARIHEEYAIARDNLATDYTRQDSIILNLQRACEATIDIAMHLVKENQLGLPQNTREAFELLEKAAFISAPVAQSMQAMGGLKILQCIKIRIST